MKEKAERQASCKFPKVVLHPWSDEIAESLKAQGIQDFRDSRGFLDDLVAMDNFERFALILTGEDEKSSQVVRIVRDYNGFVVCLKSIARVWGDSADFVCEEGKLAEALERMPSLRPTESHEDLEDKLPELCDLIRRATSRDLGHYRKGLLVRRLQRRMSLAQLDSADDYLHLLRESQTEAREFVSGVLINVTAFFRDPEVFEVLKGHIRDILKKKRAIKIWSAGCATGQEPYSLAMLVSEACQEFGVDQGQCKIIATDLDEEALSVARAGYFETSDLENVSQARIEKFFLPAPEGFTTTRDLRRLCQFSQHSLINDPPFTKLDIVVCRNVLIYLGTPLQEKLIPMFHYALLSGGLLVLGSAETVGDADVLFQRVSEKQRIYRRAEGEPSRGWLPSSPLMSSSKLQPKTPPFASVVSRIIREEFTPRACVVNEDGRILWASADLSMFLGLAQGNFHNNVVKLARSGIKNDLRSALLESRQNKRIAVRRDLRVEAAETGLLYLVDLTVQPMPEMGYGEGLYLLVFQDQPDRSRAEVSDQSSSKVEANLERELVRVREELERTVQELESANEELKSSNEELMAMNEELRVTNEELEVARDKAQVKREALAKSNNDLEHLLSCTHIPTIFVDREQRILRFTPSATRIYHLQDSDLGRPLNELAHKAIDMPELPRQAGDQSWPLKLKDGSHFVMRCSPYRQADGSDGGLVLVFTDVTQQVTMRHRLEELALVVETSADFIGICDQDLKAVYVNRAGQELTGRPAGLSISEYHPDWSVQKIKTALQLASEQADPWKGETALLTIEGVEVPVSQSIFPLFDSQHRIRAYATIARDIGEIRQREIELEKREQHFRNILLKAPSPVMLISESKQVLSMSDSLLEATGYQSNEIPKLETWLLIAHRQRSDQVRDALEPIFDGLESTVSFDAPVYTRAGEERHWAFVAARDSTTESGEVFCMLMATDLTERKQQELHLEKAADFLHKILDSLSLFVGVLSPEGILEQANQAALEAAHLEYDDVIGKPFWETFWWSFSEESKARLREAIARAAQGESIRYDVEVRVAPEQFITIDFQLVPMRDERGRVLHLIPSGLDVTNRRRDEMELKNSSMRFWTLLNSAAEAIYGIDTDGNCTFANKACIELLGFEDESALLGQNAHQLFHHSKLDGTVQASEDCEIYRAFRENRQIHLPHETFFQADGTPIPVECRAHPFLQDDNVAGCVVTFTDIRQRIADAQRLEQALDQARSASVAKSEFLANMSHEIRTPMAAILGYVDILLRHIQDPDDVECLKVIERNGQHLVRLINDILDLTKIEAGRLELEKKPVQVHQIVSELVSLMSVRAEEKDLVLQSQFRSELPSVILSDPTRLLQILVNLVGNAVKFTERGSVTLSVELVDPEFLRFNVEDTGVGIPADKLETILEPFHQADTSVTRKYGGTGLGLSICRRLVNMLGGELSIQSEVGRGSSFSFTVKIGELEGVRMLSPSSMTEELKPHAEYSLPDLSGVNVLVVDDRRDIATLAGHYISDAGGRVCFAHNGREALQSIAQSRYDVVVMDMQMPVLDGYQAVRELRESGDEIPVLALTASAMKGDRERCLAAGCNAYLSKPVDRLGLVNQIARLKAGRSSVVALVIEDNRMAALAVTAMLRGAGCAVFQAASGEEGLAKFKEVHPDLVLLDLGLPDKKPEVLLAELREADASGRCKIVAHTGRSHDEVSPGYDDYIQKPAPRASLEKIVFAVSED